MNITSLEIAQATVDAFRYNNVVTRKYWERILNTNFDNRRRGEKSDERE